MSSQPVILLEFNELCPSLLDRWIDSGELPNFNRLRNKSTICVTETDELTEPNLEPWIQWYSLHTGIPFNEHGVFRLSEGPSRPYASIWDVLLDSGRRVINFSSIAAVSDLKGNVISGCIFFMSTTLFSINAFQ